jgi:hypothetical protein
LGWEQPPSERKAAKIARTEITHINRYRAAVLRGLINDEAVDI